MDDGSLLGLCENQRQLSILTRALGPGIRLASSFQLC